MLQSHSKRLSSTNNKSMIYLKFSTWVCILKSLTKSINTFCFDVIGRKDLRLFANRWRISLTDGTIFAGRCSTRSSTITLSISIATQMEGWKVQTGLFTFCWNGRSLLLAEAAFYGETIASRRWHWSSSVRKSVLWIKKTERASVSVS